MEGQQQPYRPTPELAARFGSEIIGETVGALKLYFTVSTGALVLFINIVTASHAPRLILMLLTLSIFAFGGSSLFCLRLLIGLLQLRVMMVDAILSPEVTMADVHGKIDVWSRAMRKLSKPMEALFFVGVGLSAVFVAVLVLNR